MAQRSTVSVPQNTTVAVPNSLRVGLTKRDVLILLCGAGNPIDRSTRDICVGVAVNSVATTIGLLVTALLAAGLPGAWIAWLFFAITAAITVLATSLAAAYHVRTRSNDGNAAFVELMNEICDQLGVARGSLSERLQPMLATKAILPLPSSGEAPDSSSSG
jgi:hypothetical protein